MMLSSPKIREACGVFAIYTPHRAAYTTYLGLCALQHRGQESAGISTQTSPNTIHTHTAMGLVRDVFQPSSLETLSGPYAIGHTRYSTQGSSSLQHAQPFTAKTPHGPIALAHNGNLTNLHTLNSTLASHNITPHTSSDSERLLHLLRIPQPNEHPTQPPYKLWLHRLQYLARTAQGAFSIVALTPAGIFATRDPLGVRPLCIGRVTQGSKTIGYAVASESCAFDHTPIHFEREVQPGEIIFIDSTGLRATPPTHPTTTHAFCSLESVYFSQPNTLRDNSTTHLLRQRLGQTLALEAPADADIVIPVPDSATAAAIGYAHASNLPFSEGLIKHRAAHRTFIHPNPDDRLQRTALKYSPLPDTLHNQRVVVVDDSIVRGHTAKTLVSLLRKHGAREVHLRIASPPVRHPCFLGIDIHTHQELIAHNRTTHDLQRILGANSLAFLSLQGMMRALYDQSPPTRHCAACFSGHYPTPPPQ